MAKQKFMSPEAYAFTLTEMAQKTEATGIEVAPYFEELHDAMVAETLTEMPKAQFQNIMAEFEEAVNSYQTIASEMAALKVPVRFIGPHQKMAKTYKEYADATALMSGALDMNTQTVNMTDFNASEAAQPVALDAFMNQLHRVLTSIK